MGEGEGEPDPPGEGEGEGEPPLGEGEGEGEGEAPPGEGEGEGEPPDPCEGRVQEEEICDAVDNDCDGEVDEAAPGVPLTEACYTGEPGTLGEGVCRAGARTCDPQAGEYGPCEGDVVPAEEVCDGADNDCDGGIDEDDDGCCVAGAMNPEAPVMDRWSQICPGEFAMGAPPEDELGRHDTAQHRVRITRPFVMAATEVTQGQWEAVAREEGWAVLNPALHPGETTRPVEMVTWWGALEYLNALSEAAGLEPCYVDFVGCNRRDPGTGLECASVTFLGLDCSGYRLPTEAEWEYAARAGSAGPYPGCGLPGDDDACDVANQACDPVNEHVDAIAAYCGNRVDNRPWQVGSKLPNAWGLYEVLGNVGELVWDWYALDHGGHQGLDGVVVDPLGPDQGDPIGGAQLQHRINRGLNYNSTAGALTVTFRNNGPAGNRNDGMGFRVARTGLGALPDIGCVSGVVDPAAPIAEGWSRICPGEFLMGAPADEPVQRDDEPQHLVELTRPYLMAAAEVTQAQWFAVMGERPTVHRHCDDCPVDSVSWVDAARYCNALSDAEELEQCYVIAGDAVAWPRRLDCLGYRLPTEAEWEHAARAGATGMWHTCDAGECDATNLQGCNGPNPDLAAIAVYCANADPIEPKPIDGKPPNRWGLSGVHGNMGELVWDRSSGDYGGHNGPDAAVVDPLGPIPDGQPVTIRGGRYSYAAQDCRLAERRADSDEALIDNVGFRVARTAPP